MLLCTIYLCMNIADHVGKEILQCLTILHVSEMVKIRLIHNPKLY
jgi:hypothetical protein